MIWFVCSTTQRSEIRVASQLINALLFADDIRLMTESVQDLDTLLEISTKFASKRNLKFNANKSKVIQISRPLCFPIV